MKRMIKAALFAATAALTLSAQDSLLTAYIPFRFHVASEAFPAGKYSVGEQGTVTVVRQEGGQHKSAMAVGYSAATRADGQPKLVFIRYGDDYFLRRILSGTETGRELPISKAEKALIASRQVDRSNETIIAMSRK
jgi:hypothetical protein